MSERPLANDAAHGTELQKTNGTAAGTVLVKDINPGQFRYRNPTGITLLGDGTNAIFTATDKPINTPYLTKGGRVISHR